MDKTKTPQMERILERLTNVHESSNGWMASCPAHDDKDPSLSIGSGKDGRVLLNCLAGCDHKAVCAAIGIKETDLFAPKPEREKKRGKEFHAVPAGRYVARIHSVKEEKGEDLAPDSIRWKIRFLICSGVQKDQSIWSTFDFANERSLSELKSLCRAARLPSQGEVELQPAMFEGQVVGVQVDTFSRKDREINRILAYEDPGIITYDYVDESGTLLFQVVRFVPKAFLQRRPNGSGGWTWTIKGIRRVPYLYTDLLKAPKGSDIYQCEGEKDAENLRALGLLATTSPQGSESWNRLDPKTLEAYRDQRVTILPDQDAAGRSYAASVIESLREIAATIRVLDLPAPHKDVSDWLVAGGNRLELEALASKAPAAAEWIRKVPAREKGKGERLVIRNYITEQVDGSDGIQEIVQRIELPEILRSIRFVTNGWPKRLGQDIFTDYDGECTFLQNESDLFAFFHDIADIRWREREDDEGNRVVSRKEIFSALRTRAELVSEFSELPLWPEPSGIYISTRYRVEKETDGSCLAELLAKFNPVGPADEALLASLALTPFWGGDPGTRPFFVVTGADGIGIQATGKTTLAELLGTFAGGVFRLRLSRFGDSLASQILSDGGMRSRFVLLDNLTGPYDSADLAEAITATWIEGRPVFGRQRRRENRLTWVATAVSPELDEDLASRSVVIHIAPPDRQASPTFKEATIRFIRTNQRRLVSDAISILRGSRMKIEDEHSRFPSWDREVLACHDNAPEALVARTGCQASVSSKNDDLENLGSYLIRKFHGSHQAELTPQELCEAWNSATNKKLSVSWVSRTLRQFFRAGTLFRSIAPKNLKRHGSSWIVDVLSLAKEIESES